LKSGLTSVPRLSQALHFFAALRGDVGSAAGFPAFTALRMAISAQRTATLYCRQQHFSRDLPLWLFVFRSRQSLNVLPASRKVRSIKPSGVEIGTWKARDQDIQAAL
jgi:hypothetical protein